MTDLLFLAALVILAVVHECERQQWTRERAALLERCVPGLSVVPVEITPPRAPGDEGEYLVEVRRRKAAGLPVDEFGEWEE